MIALFCSSLKYSKPNLNLIPVTEPIIALMATMRPTVLTDVNPLFILIEFLRIEMITTFRLMIQTLVEPILEIEQILTKDHNHNLSPNQTITTEVVTESLRNTFRDLNGGIAVSDHVLNIRIVRKFYLFFEKNFIQSIQRNFV